MQRGGGQGGGCLFYILIAFAVLIVLMLWGMGVIRLNIFD